MIKQKQKQNYSLNLHGQKRGMAEGKSGLSTSRTEIPLHRHKTVTVTLGQHDTEYYTAVSQFDSQGGSRSKFTANSSQQTTVSIAHLYPVSPLTDMALQTAQEFKRLK